MRYNVFSALAAIALVGCVSGTVSDDVTIAQSVTVDLPTQGAAQTTSATLPPIPLHFDVSDTVKKISDFGSVQLSSIRSEVSNPNLGVISHIHIDMMSDGMQPVALTDVDIAPSDTTINPQVLVDTNTLQTYLSNSGGTDLSFTVTVSGNVPSNLQGTGLTLSYKLSMVADAQVSKSL